eukprot:2812910-Pyramimonas_sp.AAC.1
MVHVSALCAFISKTSNNYADGGRGAAHPRSRNVAREGQRWLPLKQISHMSCGPTGALVSQGGHASQ